MAEGKGILSWRPFGSKIDDKATVEDTRDPAAPPASGSAAPPGSASAEIVQQRKERSDKGVRKGPRGEKLSPEQAQMAQAFAELYSPQVWTRVACVPADTALALSGRKLWNLSEQERGDLGATAAMTAKCFAVENPKWLALAVLAITFGEIYGVRAALHLAEIRKEREESEKKAREPQGGKS